MAKLLDYLSEKYPAEHTKAINERLVELSSLFEISQILNATLELDNVLNNILLIPMGRLMISRGIVFIRKGETFLPRLWKGLSSDVSTFLFAVQDFPAELRSGAHAKQDGISPPLLQAFMNRHELSIVIPLKSQNQLVGLTFYGNKINRAAFRNEEIDFLNSLANISASSVENALKVDEIRFINKQLDERIQQLKTMFDITQGLSATLDSEKIVKLLTYALMGQMLVYHYAIAIYRNQNLQKLDCKGFLGDSVESLATNQKNFDDIHTSTLISDFPNAELKDRLWKIGARVFIPMRHQNKTLGFILLGEKISKQDFTSLDLEFLTTLVSQAVISLENARLFKETLEKQRIEQELQVAKTIQQKLLPHEITEIPDYDVFGLNIPSKEVGGDYFDLISLSSGQFVITVGDVSGKSVPAALLMANLQAALKIIINEEISLDQVVSKLNELIYHNTDMDKYITFFIGVLDNKNHHFTYVNAGHNPPLLLDKQGKIKQLDVGGIILGMMPEYPYQIGQVDFASGDLLVCYTDGVNEAMNNTQEEFGEERLKKVLTQNRDLASKPLSDTIVSELNEFSGSQPQADDITLIIIRRL